MRLLWKENKTWYFDICEIFVDNNIWYQQKQNIHCLQLIKYVKKLPLKLPIMNIVWESLSFDSSNASKQDNFLSDKKQKIIIIY